MEDIMSSSINFDDNDFELNASNIKSKIQTYFTNLIDVIIERRKKLLTGLDGIVSHYRQERIKNRDKINELEKMKKYHESSLYTSTVVGNVHCDVLNKIESELTVLKQMSSITVEFEWNRKYAREANEIGKLTQIPNERLYTTGEGSDVTIKRTDWGLHTFSKRLYEGLIYKTDIGPIPRDSYCEEYSKARFINFPNWRVRIEGCYWCGKVTNPNQYIYVCDKKCYQYLHEWCRVKLHEFCGESLCMYPGCEISSQEDVKFCSESHHLDLERNFKTILNVFTGKIELKTPHWYKKDPTNQKITSFFHRADIPQAVPSNTDISPISAYDRLSKQSTNTESPSKLKNLFK